MDKKFAQKLTENLSKRALENEEEEKKKREKLATIDWKGLEKQVSEYLGIPITFDIGESGRFSGRLPTFKSKENLVDASGIFAKALEDVRVESFSVGMLENEYAAGIDIRFELKRGGSNGVEVAKAWYHFDTGIWEIRGQ